MFTTSVTVPHCFDKQIHRPSVSDTPSVCASCESVKMSHCRHTFNDKMWKTTGSQNAFQMVAHSLNWRHTCTIPRSSDPRWISAEAVGCPWPDACLWVCCGTSTASAPPAWWCLLPGSWYDWPPRNSRPPADAFWPGTWSHMDKRKREESRTILCGRGGEVVK